MTGDKSHEYLLLSSPRKVKGRAVSIMLLARVPMRFEVWPKEETDYTFDLQTAAHIVAPPTFTGELQPAAAASPLPSRRRRLTAASPPTPCCEPAAAAAAAAASHYCTAAPPALPRRRPSFRRPAAPPCVRGPALTPALHRRPTPQGELVKLDKGPAMEALAKKQNLRPFMLDVYKFDYNFDRD